jgi:hypothetical protein
MVEALATTLSALGGVVFGFLSKLIKDRLLSSDCRLKIGQQEQEQEHKEQEQEHKEQD